LSDANSPDFLLFLTRAVVTGVMLFTYGYDWVRVLDQYRDPHDRRRASTFRALIKSSVLTVLILVVFLGSVNGAFFQDNPEVASALRWAAWILTVSAFIGGFALVTSWKREELPA
jgi:hypothetical protein